MPRFLIVLSLCLLFTILARECEAQYAREGMFWAKNYSRAILPPIKLNKHIGLSFRSCDGGQLFSQRSQQYSMQLDVRAEGLSFNISIMSKSFITRISAPLIDNQWHNIIILYRMGNLTISTLGHLQVIANSSYNAEILRQPDLVTNADVFTIGEGFSGCVLEGPNIVFNSTQVTAENVKWGPCPMPFGPCSSIVDPCAHEPCMNHGHCILLSNHHYFCKCSSRYSGANCQIDNGPPCDTHPCQNGGSCIEDPMGGYSCYCPGGWAGINCDVKVDTGPCQNNLPCQNNATCVRVGNSNMPDYKCNCLPGYEGRDCEINIDECFDKPCENGGICEDSVNGFICHCDRTGYSGKQCEANINECENNPCLNNGICFDNYGGYTCQCVPGFGGQNCEQKLNDCSVNRCPHPNTMCVDGNNSYQCVCKPGFGGDNCESSAEEWCDPCTNGGLYMRTGEGYFCLCKPGFSGEDCSIPLSCMAKPCHHASACYDFPGGYFCACEAGWTGLHCDQLLTNHCTPNPCKNSGICTQSLTDFFCSCKEGFTGQNCEHGPNDNCMARTCYNGGTCIDAVNGVFCNCTPEYMGPLCEDPFNACGPTTPCKNNGTCNLKNDGHEYYCECLPGYEGLNCESNVNDCNPNTCPEPKICIDGVNSYECRCPDGLTGPDCNIEVGLCSSGPCKNSATCIDTPGNYSCVCPVGWKGFDCSVDVDECANQLNPCNDGLCVNKNGTFECYCKPGFSGVHCEFDVDECLSRPCRNGATCENKINAFACICLPGFTGIDCGDDIDECQSNPCFNGSTCRDEVATFSCECPPGITGRRCETNIDDCESSPCMNGGKCQDALNSYTCECSNTGFEGLTCDINIDECVSSPCIHGGQCVDGINGYECQCQPGYQGAICEVDIKECDSNPCQHNSTCKERSIEAYYMSGDPLLPKHFNQTFDYAIAAGYDCICIKGTQGTDCEININECESNPCQNKALCHDLINGYTCQCEPGYEGIHCGVEINECERYKPCVHGTCFDGIAQYSCECNGIYGGKNCSVELTACQTNHCLNGGTCIPYLEGETVHKFNCSCTNGFQGSVCEKVTTMSFNGSSYAVINTSREEGYDIQFRFKTTLSDGLLAVGKGPTFYFLRLVNGRVNLLSSILNKWEGVFIGQHLNDSNWQKVFVAINSSHLVLAANEEQTIYPINLNNEAATSNHTSFPVTFLGGVVASLRKYTSGISSRWLIGCMQDVMINTHWILPNEEGVSSSVPMSYVGVEVGCQREEQCDPNPCHGHGECTDYWNFFKCDCARPYLGSTCQYNYTAATFGHENVTDSMVTVTVDPLARRAVRSILDISMFIRTREPAGGIFYLGSKPSSVNYTDETVIAAKLINGELKINFQFNGILESYGVDGVRLDNGFNHLIQVVRNVTTVQVKINGTEYFRKTISATGPLDLQYLLLGAAPSNNAPNNPPVRNFKGVIQDVQMNSGSKQMVLEFYPLMAPDIPENERPLSIGEAVFDKSLVLQGVVSDDACNSQPCAHGGTCVVTWNDFYCQCTVGHKGKQCQEMEFCQVQDCPSGSECRNLNTGYECVANITIHSPNETAPGLHYEFVHGDSSAELFDITVTYRSKTGGTILQVGESGSSKDDSFLLIYIYNDQIIVAWSISGEEDIKNVTKDPPDGEWTTLSLKMSDNSLTGSIVGGLDEITQVFTAHNFSVSHWDTLVRSSRITVGGSSSNLRKLTYTTAEGVLTNDVELAGNDKHRFGEYFLGCIGEVRIGGLLLPYFTQAVLNNSNSSNKDHFELTEGSSLGETLGCLLCFEEECQNGANCTDPESSYSCHCQTGYDGDVCEHDINECENNNECLHNSTCIDLIGSFSCQCSEGYQGDYCGFETNECLSNPCQNGGTCQDRLARFECICPSEYVGPMCEQARQITCLDEPCHNHGSCQDIRNQETSDNFTCSCEEGFVGHYCESAFCAITPCQHGDCVNKISKPSCACHPGYGGKFCEVDLNECDSNPCEHGGKCIDGIASFTCDCWKTGYRGGTCSEDINECVEAGEEICENSGTCRNLEGSYICDCLAGFCGMNCSYPDPCSTTSEDNSICFNGGICRPNCIDMPDYVCECTSSFTGKNCTVQVVYASSRVADIALIVVPILTILLLAGVVSLFVFLMMARKKRATRGTYSPSSQEYCNPRVELDNVMKPPPEERLI